MSDLNYKYRGKKDTYKRALLLPDRRGTGSVQPDLLGDVVICTDRAVDDAAELRYTNSEMVLYLLIHGILHLIGYEHSQQAEAEMMQAEVERIFQEFAHIEISP